MLLCLMHLTSPPSQELILDVAQLLRACTQPQTLLYVEDVTKGRRTASPCMIVSDGMLCDLQGIWGNASAMQHQNWDCRACLRGSRQPGGR